MALDGSYKKLAAANLRRTERYVRYIEELLRKATGRFVSLSAPLNYDRSLGQFYFDDYPEVRKAIDETVAQLASGMQQAVIAGTSAEWANGTKDANGILDYVMKRVGLHSVKDLKPEVVGKYLNNHDSALKAFQQRQIGGISLSERVWNLANQSRIESELARSIAEGTSADELAESMKELLQEPNRLYRRVRDEFGDLHLSKNARAYNPGTGVYRSSYKNAMRLARTEINMAYRNAELESYREDPEVVGYEVKRSNHPYDCPVCAALKGRYPKDFKWNGWHPNCRCFIVPILLTDEEFLRSLEEDDFDPTTSKNYVGDVPDGFKAWCEANEARIEDANQWGTLPYFLQDNRDYMWSALSQDSKMLRALQREIDYYPSEYREDLQRLLEQKASAPVISGRLDSIAKDIQGSIIPWSVEMSGQSSVIRGMFEKLDTLDAGDFKGRIQLMNKIKEKAAVLTRWNLREDGIVNGLEYIGFEKNHTFSAASTYTTKNGVSVNIPRHRKDVIKYKDKSGKEYWLPLGARRSNVSFNPAEASQIIGKMYPGMQRSFKGLFFDTELNQLDAFYKIEYSMPNFVGAAYSGEPISFHFYGNTMSATQFEKTLAHEIGHHLDKVSSSKKWADAISADKKYITEYAKKSVREDFADHFAISYQLLAKGNNEIEWFIKEFPNRWALLRDIFLQIYR